MNDQIERMYVKTWHNIADGIHGIARLAINRMINVWPGTNAGDGAMPYVLKLASFWDKNMPVPVDLTAGSIISLFEFIRKNQDKIYSQEMLDELISRHAKNVDRATTRELSKALRISLKKDLPEIEALARKWVDENIRLVKHAFFLADDDGGKKALIDDLIEHALRIFSGDATVSEMQGDLEMRLGISRHRAEFIARDQVLKLAGRISQERQSLVGVTEYVWITSKDSRVRPSHARLHGKRQQWSTPPNVGNGRYEHPGGDYVCRCTAKPVPPPGLA